MYKYDSLVTSEGGNTVTHLDSLLVNCDQNLMQCCWNSWNNGDGHDKYVPFQQKKFWFATGGAGFCLSRALVNKMKPYIRYCSCNYLRSVHDVIWLGVTAVRMEQIFWRDWLLTRQKEIISLLHFVSALFVFWSQLTNLFVRNFKQTSFFFLSVRHFGVFLATKAVFLAGIGIENGWCLSAGKLLRGLYR